MSPLGVKESDCLFTRVPILELDAWQPGASISSGVLDLVDFFPAKHFRVFNPSIAPPIAGTQELPFPTSVLGASDGAFPEPRFVAHYYIASDVINRSLAASSYMELRFTTSSFGVFPTAFQFPLATIPWVGPGAILTSLATGATIPGEAQSGQIVIPGRTLMVTALFNATDPGGSFSLGVYLAPITG